VTLKTSIRHACVALAGAALLAGCSTMVDIRQGAQDAQAEAKDSARTMLHGRPAKASIPVRGPLVTDVPFVNTTPVPVVGRYPINFSRVVVLNEPHGVPLSLLASRVQAVSGITISYQAEVQGNAPAMDVSEANGQGGLWTNLPQLPNGLPQLASQGRAPALQPAFDPMANVAVNYSGSVRGALDAIAAATKSAWEYDESAQRVNFFRFKTQGFRLAAVQGRSTSKVQLGGQKQGSNGQAIATASAESSHTTDASLWQGVEEALKKLISAEGAYAINQAAGTILVRDIPSRMEQVARYMEETNRSMSRQVDVEVQIYRVAVNDKDVRGLNWNVVFQNLIATSPYNLSLSTERPSLVDGIASAILKIPERDANGVPHRYGGSSMFIDALSTLGNTSLVNTTSVIAVNNRPTPVKVVRRIEYVAQSAQTYASGNGAVVNAGPTLTPGTVETGLNMYVLPHVQDDGKRMLLKLMVSLSTLEDMKTITSGGSTIQLPQVASREFEQEAWLNSGETLVLAGFEQIDSGLETKSPFDKSVWALGGSRTASKGREMVVVAIRPVVTSARSRI